MKPNYFSYDLETAGRFTEHGQHILDYMQFSKECTEFIHKSAGIPFSEFRPESNSIDERLILMA